MALTAFDTHKFVHRLKQAGMPAEQAEVQAELLTEAFKVNVASLVIKECFESRWGARFAEQDACIDTRFAELEAKVGSNHRIFLCIQAIIMAAVILPKLERLVAGQIHWSPG